MTSAKANVTLDYSNLGDHVRLAKSHVTFRIHPNGSICTVRYSFLLLYTLATIYILHLVYLSPDLVAIYTSVSLATCL